MAEFPKKPLANLSISRRAEGKLSPNGSFANRLMNLVLQVLLPLEEGKFADVSHIFLLLTNR
jgi:hypothetical protein